MLPPDTAGQQTTADDTQGEPTGCVVLCSYKDGTVKVAPSTPNPQDLAQAESFTSMDEALKAVQSVMGEESAPGDAEQDAANGGEQGEMGGAAAPGDDTQPRGTSAPAPAVMDQQDEAAFQGGYKGVRRGR